MAFLLFAQLGMQGSGLGVETAQLSLFASTLDVPGMRGVPGVVALDLQQFDFAAQRGQLGLPGRVDLTEVSDFIATGFQLGVQAVLRQQGHRQPLLQQCHLRLRHAGAALQLPG